MDTKKIGEFIAACRKEKGTTQKELADALGITNRAVSINKKPIKWKKKISAKCLLGALACFAAAFLALSMQIVYLTLGKRYQMEYIYDFLPYIVNIAAIGSFFAGIYFLTKGSRKIQKLVAGICILFLVINAVFWIKDLKTMRTSIIRISPGYKKMLILKKEDSGQVSIYKNQKLWFARRSDQFPYTVSKYMKTQWLADDICAVTYYSPDDDAVHQYVATYGDRGDGITTPYVYNMISGSWAADNKNIAGWSLEVGIDGLNIHNGSKRYHYEAKDCVQFGTLALALCENGLPQWTIALNEDCVEEDGYLTEGTITLCKVSLEKTAPMRFYGSGRKKYFEESAEPLSDKEAGQKIKKEMEEVLLEDKRLANFESVRDKVKVVTESTDLFWISRLALEENEKLSVLEGYGFDVQIDRMRIIAGDQYDFVVKIESTDTFTETDKEDEDGVQMEFIFRIMKGENAYLAVCLPYGVDGTVGLEAPGMEQSRVTKDDPQYHFFGKGIAK